jgi:four helix bundle protein
MSISLFPIVSRSMDVASTLGDRRSTERRATDRPWTASPSSTQSYQASFACFEQDLLLWHEGMMLADLCYGLTDQFPKTEVGSIAIHIRHAATLLSGHIAQSYEQGWLDAHRDVLRQANDYLLELESHLRITERLGIVTAEAIAPIYAQCAAMRLLINGRLVS